MPRQSRYRHPFVDGQIVHDTRFKETFMFLDRKDGFRAHHYPNAIRPATPEEEAEWEAKQRNTVTNR